ncbi:zinc-dependent alcohol dehydrogenase family protein [Plantibacter sp. MCCC 1A11337]|uniref:zinc-dependent alcohol dehydrogenase family protein n=1 Tax=Plantibacter TaxID=190323 RepID=UPI0015818D76|nr:MULTISPECIES: zinc-dependent alcohol dehydrogenase family protein [unclassified Plantibacter]NUJ87762.1 zinc-dependent alcohol dehydrogenase family protein [Plantibacter sp. MCCC 1A11337]
MRAVVYDQFTAEPEVRDVPDPVPSDAGVVVRVETTGLCRSDAHGWLGHDDGIALPHVPGHELVGRIHAVGPAVERFRVGDRVTVPFVCACGRCAQCLAGNGQVCPNQTQPGFTHWGSYAELVALHDADVNLIPVPESLDAGAAALLGCRFATAFRGLVHRAGLRSGERLLVVGCGGVGLSAAMIGVALGAEVIAVDIDASALARAASIGVTHTIDSSGLDEAAVLARIAEAAPAGVQVSVEALGRESTMRLSLLALAPMGRQVQIGLFSSEPTLPLPRIISQELSLHGSHGMPASDYSELLELVSSGALRPQDLIEHRIGLDEAPAALVALASGDRSTGVTVIDVA